MSGMELNEKKIYTVEETSNVLQIRRETVLKLIYNKSLRASKVGRIWRIHGDDILKFLRENENTEKITRLEDGEAIFFKQ